MTTVLEMVDQYLKAHGYDGLFRPDGECACQTSGLAPCDEIGTDCEAGYYVAGCPEDCGEGHTFHITREKPTPPQEQPDETG